MRYKGRTVLAALVAALALGAVASASALAAPPEFTLGNIEPFPSKIEASLHSGSASLEGTFSLGSCSADRTTGEIAGVKAASLTLEFTGCGKNSTSVNSKGAASGVIVIPGSGSLVFINKAKEQVGILFTLKETVTLEAGAEKFELSGDIVFPITPINTETHSFTLPIHSASPGLQQYRSYENEKGEVQNTSLKLELGGNYQAESIEITGSNEVTSGTLLTVATTTAPITWLTSFGSGGSGNGQFAYPESAAVAPNGDVYVADTANNRVEEFSASGTFIEALGWGVSNGEAKYEICPSTGKCQAGIAGSGKGQFKHPTGIAVAAKGEVYVADGENERVDELSSTGEYLRQLGSEGNGEGQLGHKSVWGWEGPSAVAIAPNGHVYVTVDGGSSNRVVGECPINGGSGLVGLVDSSLEGYCECVEGGLPPCGPAGSASSCRV
jgi:hypothetical protein